MKIYKSAIPAIFGIGLGLGISFSVQANHKDGHADSDPYNCTIMVEKNGRLEEKQLGSIDCILHKLDRIERKIGCPIDEYLDGSCPYSPADTTATFCISQGREGGVDIEFGAEANAEYDVGAGWPNAAWAKAIGNIEHPVIAGYIPVPTELNITGAASLGRNFDICIELPLIASNQLGPLEDYSDVDLIDLAVRAINEPQVGAKSKFQRRLGRLTDYTLIRIPGTNRFGLAMADSGQTRSSALLGDGGESEFDLVEDAIERLMNGDFEIPQNGGPLAILKSPIIQDLSSVLEVPSTVHDVLEDPDMIIGTIFEMGSLAGGIGGKTGVENFGLDVSVCDSFGFNIELQERFPSVRAFCGVFSVLPAFGQTTGIFGVVGMINTLVSNLPTLTEINDRIRETACDIAWTCSDSAGSK
jgi:hypothetical protein